MRTPLAEPNAWLSRFAWITAAATLLLICTGGMVTSKGAGLAVPDWPTSFGYNMFLFPVSKWVGGIFFEHVHRLIASTVGFLTIILALWAWRVEARRWVRSLALAALGAVIVQGVLGGLRVTLLQDEIGIFHACLAQAFLAMLIVLALATSPRWFARDLPNAHEARWLALAVTAMIYLQLALGATMRHEHRDLAIFDFPTAYGQWIPDTSDAHLAQINQWRNVRAFSEVTAFHIRLQMAHRFGAVLIAVGVIAFALRVRRAARTELNRLSAFWIVLLCAQITLGAWTIWSNKAADIATAHLAVGATMLATGVSLCALCFRPARAIPLAQPSPRFQAMQHAAAP